MKSTKFKKLLAVILSFSMISIPTQNKTKAEVEPTNWSKEINEDTSKDIWPVLESQRIEKQNVDNNNGMRVPTISYAGTYKTKNNDGDECEVVRCTFNRREAGARHTKYFTNLVIKVNKELDDLIDWGSEKTGFFTGGDRGMLEDNTYFQTINRFASVSEDKVGIKVNKELDDLIDWGSEKTGFFTGGDRGMLEDNTYFQTINRFASVSEDKVGIKDARYIDLLATKNTSDNVLGRLGSNRYSTPFQFVLKPGRSVKELKRFGLVQARIYNNDKNKEEARPFSRILMRSDNLQTGKDGKVPYSNFTLSTIIPKNVDLNGNLNYFLEGGSNFVFNNSDCYLRYNAKEGYIDVINKYSKKSSGDDFYGEPYAFYQSFDRKFLDILKKDKDGRVGFIATTDSDDTFFAKDSIFRQDGSINWDTNTLCPIQWDDINNKKGDMPGLDKDTAFIQASNGKWQKMSYEISHNINTIRCKGNFTDALICAKGSYGNGLGTTVRFFVDTDKIEKYFDPSGLQTYGFYFAYVVQPNMDYPHLKWTHIMDNSKMDNGEKLLKRGTEVKLDFVNPQVKGKVLITIGEGVNAVTFRNSISGSNTKFKWTVPYDILLKPGDKFNVYAQGYKKKKLQDGDFKLTISGLEDFYPHIPVGAENADYTLILKILKKMILDSLISDDIVGISISTRPDCVLEKHLLFLKKIEKEKNIQIDFELGLQSVNYRTLIKINRGHTLAEFIHASNIIHKFGFRICTHMIIGLPFDDELDIIEGAKILSSLNIEEVKLHSLYIVKGTKLCQMYLNGEINMIDKETFIDYVILFLRHLDKNIVVQRLLGRVPEENSVFCNWNTSWWKIRDEIIEKMKKNNYKQADLFNEFKGVEKK